MGDVFSGGFEGIALVQTYSQADITNRKREQIGKPEMPSLFLCEAGERVIFRKKYLLFF